jgi:hypothetical protein
MFRVFVTAMALSFVCGLSAYGAQSNCPRTIITCDRTCAVSQFDKKASCSQICRSAIINCDAGSDEAQNRLPDGELPSDQLPQSRLPSSNLPDSLLN